MAAQITNPIRITTVPVKNSQEERDSENTPFFSIILNFLCPHIPKTNIPKIIPEITAIPEKTRGIRYCTLYITNGRKLTMPK